MLENLLEEIKLSLILFTVGIFSLLIIYLFAKKKFPKVNIIQA